MQTILSKYMHICILFLATSLFGQTTCPSNTSQYAINVQLQGVETGEIGGLKQVGVRLSRTSTVQQKVEFNFSIAPNNQGIIPNGQIDFGDGNGFKPFLPNSTVVVIYPSFGNKQISITYNAPKFSTTTFNINLRALTPGHTYKAPDEVWDIFDDALLNPNCMTCLKDPNMPSGLAKAYIRYSTANRNEIKAAKDAGNPISKTLRKVLVFVEGIDFSRDSITSPEFNCKAIRYGDFGWDLFWMGHNEIENDWDFIRKMPQVHANLDALGYDVILLDFRNGADHIENNTLLLKKLLVRISNNRRSDENNITHQIAVIGASMGGQVVKLALGEMEKEDKEHCTNTYISFDSPQQGANIPVSLQALSFLFEMNPSPSVPKQWTLKLKRPAARQLLVEHLENNATNYDIGTWANVNSLTFPLQPGAIVGNNSRTAFAQKMAALGYPKHTYNVAIACGSQTATPQYAAGTSLLDINGEYLGSNSFRFFTMKMNAVGGANRNTSVKRFYYAIPGPLFTTSEQLNYFDNSGRTLFAGAFPNTDKGIWFDKLPGEYFSLFVRRKSAATIPLFDSAPGATRKDFAGLKTLIKQTIEAEDSNIEVQLDASTPDGFCFIPSISALDVNTNVLSANIKNLGIVLNKLTPFERFYAPEGANLQHVEIDDQMISRISEWVQDAERDLAPTLPSVYKGINYSSYNFGYVKRLIPSVSINNGGVLSINQVGASSYGNRPNTDKSEFHAYLKDCGSSYVVINNGGRLSAGSDDGTQSGIIHVPNGSILENNGGELNLKANSKLIVEKGGLLHLKGGILRLLNTSQIIVEDGGKLIIEPNVMVVLNNSATVASSEAKIVIQPRATLQLTGLNTAGFNFTFSGNGHFVFNEDNILKMEDLNNNPVDFKWKGAGKGLRMIKLNNAKLDIPERNVDIRVAAIEYNDASMIHMNKGKSLTLVDVKAYTPTNGKTFKQATAFVVEEGEGTINVKNCTFSDLVGGLNLFAKEEKFAKILVYTTSHNYNVYVNASTLFERCNTGVNILNNQGNVNFSNNTTCKDNRVGVFIDSNAKTVSFNSCVFEQNGIGSMIRRMPLKGSVQYANTTMDKNVHGSVLYAIKSAVYYDCNILNHNYEISENDIQVGELLGSEAPDAIGFCGEYFACGILDLYNSNIVATQGTKFLNNNFGIYKYVDGVYENDPRRLDAIVLDCVTFDNNKYAVKGRDIIMQNDALFSQMSLGYPLRSNNFIQNKEGIRLFDIAYTGKGQIIPKLVQMRNNYWQTQLNIGNAPDPMTINFKVDLASSGGVAVPDCEHCSTSNSCINYETAPELDAIQKECPFITYTNPDPSANSDLFDNINNDCKCNVAVSESANGGATNNVHAQYRMAYAYLVSEKNPDVDKAMELLTPIALLPLSGGEQAISCDHYIKMARAFTDIYPGEKDDIPINPIYSKVQKNNGINIYPNPTSDLFYLRLPKGSYKISVFDPQGRNIKQIRSQSQENTIETQSWESGIYQVLVKSESTGEMSWHKVVIVR